MKISLVASILLCAAFGTALAQQARDASTATQADRRALAERRQKMIERCQREHGIDCEREVDTELRAESLPSGSGLIRLEQGRGP